MDLINRCPEVIELTGTPIERKGLVKGKMSSGVADMHFLIKGPKGQVVVSVGGTLREGSKTEYDLQSIKISNRSKKDEVSLVLYDNYQPQLEFLPVFSFSLSQIIFLERNNSCFIQSIYNSNRRK